jgi:glucosyl-3-phosphoglycerate synthase
LISMAKVASKSAPAKRPRRRKPAGSVCETSVLDWFNRNTFHHSQFEDIERLMELKQQQRVKISLGIPTLNEADNVANVISVLRESLYVRHHLLDEIAIIDSGSQDNTVAIAERAGAKVIESERHLREFGAFYGKGENLWKSLHVLRGDILCWVDADIKNIHPKYVYGLVGPLLHRKGLGYARGFYRRAITFKGNVVSYGGGRTTEIAVRPLLNLFFPELTGFVQPLCGQAAGRREVFEKIPFSVGYGVEIGHLIDISRKFGLGKMCQVDLGEVEHENKETAALGRQAFSIMQVISKRLAEREKAEFLEKFCRVYRFPEIREDAGKQAEYFLSEKEIVEKERPPIRSLPDYVERKRMDKDFLAKVVDFVRDSKRRHKFPEQRAGREKGEKKG